MTITPAMQQIKTAVEARYGSQITNMGVYNRRPIAGTSKWSQHAWGNAWDIGGSPTTLAAVYNYLAANRATLGIGTLCYKHFGPCSAAAHQDHIHVEPAIVKTGTPPESSGGGGEVGGGGTDDGARAGLGVLTDPTVWQRVAAAVGGVALVALGAAVIAGDTNPIGKVLK